MGNSKKKIDLGRALIKQRWKCFQLFTSVSTCASNSLRVSRPATFSPSNCNCLLIHSRFAVNPNFKVNDDGYTVNSHMEDSDFTPVSNFNSITEENDLTAFLASAELAEIDFTAEKLNVSIISTNTQNTRNNPFLLTAQQEKEIQEKHFELKNELKVPKRPNWNKSTTSRELEILEKESFLNWRRGLVWLEEQENLILTPYEKNIQIWRQLWRVIEKSDLIVLIVDARNPLFFYSQDLQKYVKQVDESKMNLLLVNKADMLTRSQRIAWAEYFEKQGIEYIFFSAVLAREEQEAIDLMKQAYLTEAKISKSNLQDKGQREQQIQGKQEKEKIIGALDLLKLFKRICPESIYSKQSGRRTIGFVGYPNVGKSSTLNALVGATRVKVGTTPGKTKHFQTICLDGEEGIMLCDCPGLVFPSFATTKAEMVVDGVLPIDQMREYIGPIGLIARRIPKYYLEAIYGLTITTRNVEGALEYRAPTSEELLRAYAVARGMTKSSQGNPDEARAARVLLKDYVSGKLLWVSPPPGLDQDERERFNAEVYERQVQELKEGRVQEMIEASTVESKREKKKGGYSTEIDKEFFNQQHIKALTKGHSLLASNDFKRVTRVYDQQGGASVEFELGDKKHRKERRTKKRNNWTKQE